MFEGKKITIMGIGRLGRGVGDILYLLEKGAEVIATDLKTEEELKESIEKLKSHKNAKNLKLTLGKHEHKDFEGRDLVLVGPAIPKNSEFVKTAFEKSRKVSMSTALFAKKARELGVTLVGVTGTKGKSTTAFMIFNSLVNSENFDKENIFLGGNVKGVSTLSLLDEINKDSIVVLELDSWQLQGFGWEKVSPNIAVFTNFFEDHLNYYKSMEEYFEDKSNIYRYQSLKKGDAFFVGPGFDKRFLEKFPPPVPEIEVSRLPEDFVLSVPGVHNRANAALAREVLAQLGMSENEIKERLYEFSGVPGRFEIMGKYKEGDKSFYFVNDNNSTTPKSTLLSLDTALDLAKDVVIILGGNDKGLDISELAERLNKAGVKLILTPGSGTEKLKKELKVNFVELPTKEAIEKAVSLVEDEGVVLFSPGFSSFAEFSNEYEREALVKDILKKYEKESVN